MKIGEPLDWRLDKSVNVDSTSAADVLAHTNHVDACMSRLLMQIEAVGNDKRDSKTVSLHVDQSLIRAYFKKLKQDKVDLSKSFYRRFAEYGRRKKWRDEHNVEHDSSSDDDEDEEGAEVKLYNMTGVSRSYVALTDGREKRLKESAWQPAVKSRRQDDRQTCPIAVADEAAVDQYILFECKLELPTVKPSECEYDYPSYSQPADLFRHYGHTPDADSSVRDDIDRARIFQRMHVDRDSNDERHAVGLEPR